TLEAGGGLCKEEVVRFVVEQAQDRLGDLISYGVEFDRDKNGRFSLGKEGGHRHKRIVHCKDATGAGVSAALLSNVASLPNITLLTNHAVLDLITSPSATLDNNGANCCRGAIVLNLINGTVSNFFARVTILATGGVGQLYSVTTNPCVATGDGIAIARRAGAKVSNMEFIQFHPTALASFDTDPCFLISEAVRGQGAHLVTESGERFMFKYHQDGELACRDIVARAIATEISASNGTGVFLDCAPIATDFQDKFPAIFEKCMSVGIDVYFNPIPVLPAAHYLCGGIDADINSRTTIENLYACGECANTGLHGANRLASNSLLEAMVFAHACYLDIAMRLDHIPLRVEALEVKTSQPLQDEERALVSETRASLRKLMTEQVGIIRSKKGLNLTKNCLADLGKLVDNLTMTIVNADLQELKNIIEVAQLIVDHSLQRKENCGAYFNIDLAINHRFPLKRALQD
ncbi:MAG: L-aspartate oxidase, partial [Bacteroidota bacterium]